MLSQVLHQTAVILWRFALYIAYLVDSFLFRRQFVFQQLVVEKDKAKCGALFGFYPLGYRKNQKARPGATEGSGAQNNSYVLRMVKDSLEALIRYDKEKATRCGATVKGEAEVKTRTVTFLINPDLNTNKPKLTTTALVSKKILTLKNETKDQNKFSPNLFTKSST